MALFAALAVTLKAVGMYGVMSYSVTWRTHEFGVRMALGAGAWDVLGEVMSQGVKLALAGVAFGIAGALVLGRALSSLLYEVSPSDPATLAIVVTAAIAVAVVACYLPARRATAADPMTALRAD